MRMINPTRAPDIARLEKSSRVSHLKSSLLALLIQLIYPSLSAPQEIWKTEHKKISVPVWQKVEVPITVEVKVPEWKVNELRAFSASFTFLPMTKTRQSSIDTALVPGQLIASR
jgi:hypothetical protein